MGTGEKKALREALADLAELLWRRVTDRSVAAHELEAAFERAERVAAEVGVMKGPLHEVLCELGEGGFDCAEALDELVDRTAFDLADRIAAVFEIVAPDDGAVERARIRARSGKRSAVKQLETIVGDYRRSRSSRLLALQCLGDVHAYGRLARCAPALLQEAIESADRAWMYQVASALHDAFFYVDQGEDDARDELAAIGRTAGAAH